MLYVANFSECATRVPIMMTENPAADFIKLPASDSLI